tara:strand:- start:708 stop:1148 length:441 start_codon:yes stop_codon:yes gene_type:complete
MNVTSVGVNDWSHFIPIDKQHLNNLKHDSPTKTEDAQEEIESKNEFSSNLFFEESKGTESPKTTLPALPNWEDLKKKYTDSLKKNIPAELIQETKNYIELTEKESVWWESLKKQYSNSLKRNITEEPTQETNDELTDLINKHLDKQ